jgi:predicted XRE-type DNA-binding protein
VPVSRDDPIYALRAQLAEEIVRALGGSFAQHFISARYGISQPRMSELCRGNVGRCSTEWLIRRVHRMGGTVRLVVELGDPEAARSRRLMMERRRCSAERFASGGPIETRAGAAGGVLRVKLIPNLE